MIDRAKYLARNWVGEIADDLKKRRRHCEETRFCREDAHYDSSYLDAHKMTIAAIDRAIAALGIESYDEIIPPHGASHD